MGLLDSIKQVFSGEKQREIGNIDPICPYCSKVLESKPLKKKKCPECSEFIYVRTRPSDKEKVLVTESQAEQIEEQWSIADGTHEFYLAEKEVIKDLKKEMIAKFGRIPSDHDVKWHLYNKQCHEAARGGNWKQYRDSRFRMADLLRNENRLEDALPLYLEVSYLDLNGATGKSTDHGFLAPQIVERISTIVGKLKLTPNDIGSSFRRSMKEQYGSLNLRFSPDAAWARIESEIFTSIETSDIPHKDEAHEQSPKVIYRSGPEPLISQDINYLIKELYRRKDPLDVHFIYLNVIGQLYQRRNEPEMRTLLKKLATEHIERFESFAGPLVKSIGFMPSVPTFKYLAIALTEEGEYKKAIEVCEKAMSYGVHDGTKGGFPARIERIKKKMLEG